MAAHHLHGQCRSHPADYSVQHMEITAFGLTPGTKQPTGNKLCAYYQSVKSIIVNRPDILISESMTPCKSFPYNSQENLE